MDRYRYPIGQFEPVREPTSEQRNTWIEVISVMPANLRMTVSNLTMDQLLTPYRPGGWTVQQVVHHMADNDMNAYIRFKRALTEDDPVSSSYREDSWAQLSDYQNTPIETSIVLLEALHSRFAVLLRSLPPSDFNRTFTSPTHGRMSLDLAAQRFAWHNQHHIAQIESLKNRMGWN
ncbi:YfiT family bacillithiol transferase [Paenibacillus mendelii]|uniref:Putative metal-dependent hydrolase ACFFJ8_23430 n=1 Tax=Paenibacillus mendelii TaxID=206163 RepID=A0ABV6JID8_9BACL|nr:putative metal-dependent hydrolase [Paenibacillus mendelii]MCQ6557177.1 putative metal-dependent hydrolase [Paenibacillus mendelii]